MAVKVSDPRKEVNVVLRAFAMQATQSLRRNFRTQHVWPNLLYPGYDKVNEERRENGSWYATGEGEKSFSWRVDPRPGRETIVISFLEYLRFVDMGVGRGRTFEDVQHKRKARHNRRYVNIWSARMGESHRPAIMMEMRHLQYRMQNYFEDFYGREVNFEITKSLNGIGEINLNL